MSSADVGIHGWIVKTRQRVRAAARMQCAIDDRQPHGGRDRQPDREASWGFRMTSRTSAGDLWDIYWRARGGLPEPRGPRRRPPGGLPETLRRSLNDLAEVCRRPPGHRRRPRGPRGWPSGARRRGPERHFGTKQPENALQTCRSRPERRLLRCCGSRSDQAGSGVRVAAVTGAGVDTGCSTRARPPCDQRAPSSLRNSSRPASPPDSLSCA